MNKSEISKAIKVGDFVTVRKLRKAQGAVVLNTIREVPKPAVTVADKCRLVEKYKNAWKKYKTGHEYIRLAGFLSKHNTQPYIDNVIESIYSSGFFDNK